SVIPQVLVYGSLVGTVIGALSQLFILLFDHLAKERGYTSLIFNETSSGVIGGAIGGVLTGAVGGLYFARFERPAVDPSLLLVGAGIGTICIILGSLLYEYNGRWRNLPRIIIIS